VNFCHQHNVLQGPVVDNDRRYGIRVTLPAADTFNSLLGADWERIHWFTTEDQRDTAFEKMATRHGYYRKTDSPSQVLEKLKR
jgi:hypothetical protein